MFDDFLKKRNFGYRIPTYKRPELLKNALNSLKMQSYKNIKIIIGVKGNNDEIEKYKIIKSNFINELNIEFYFHNKTGVNK